MARPTLAKVGEVGHGLTIISAACDVLVVSRATVLVDQ
jgi:hypothetical protein